MAHYAKVVDNVVTEVIVVRNTDIDEDNEEIVNNYLHECGIEGTWLRCSYNTHRGVHNLNGTPFRGNYPGVNMVYDQELDMFINNKKMSDDAIFDEETYSWVIPGQENDNQEVIPPPMP